MRLIPGLLGLEVSQEGHRKQEKQITLSRNRAPTEPSASWGWGERLLDPEPSTCRDSIFAGLSLGSCRAFCRPASSPGNWPVFQRTRVHVLSKAAGSKGTAAPVILQSGRFRESSFSSGRMRETPLPSQALGKSQTLYSTVWTVNQEKDTGQRTLSKISSESRRCARIVDLSLLPSKLLRFSVQVQVFNNKVINSDNKVIL